jgi:hypothetical protein
MIMVAIVCYLRCTIVVYGLSVIVYGHQQRCPFNCSDDKYPLQYIPISSQEVSQYTMWTPQNWTTQKINNHQSNRKQPQLNYNAYLVTSTSPGNTFFQIITPSIMYRSNKMNAMRIDTNDGIKKSFGSDSRNFYKSYSSSIQNNNLQRTSEQSLYHHCTYAINGGPFHSDGSSVGVVVVQNNGTQHILSNDFGPNIGIGISIPNTTRNNTTTDKVNGTTISSVPSTTFWVIGRLDNEAQIRALNVQQFVTGFDWLVYNYTNIPQQLYHNNGIPSTIDASSRASRSTIGITSDGKLLLFVTDGCEHWFV